MKTSALTLTTLFVLGTFAYAGPEPYSGKDMKQVVPVPPICHNWSGFYIGGFAGYKFGSVDVDLEPTGAWDAFPADDAIIRDEGSGDLDTHGFEAGGLIGYNFQVNCWVFGIEATGAYLWLDDSSDSGIFSITGGGSDKHITTSFESHYLMTVAPRFGYAFGNFLPYVTGGLAVGHLDFFQQLENVPPGAVYSEGGSKDELRVGWTVGGGLQYAINNHWSVRGQYQYVDLGSVSFDAPGSANFPAFTGHHEASLREHNVSAALIYGF